MRKKIKEILIGIFWACMIIIITMSIAYWSRRIEEKFTNKKSETPVSEPTEEEIRLEKEREECSEIRKKYNLF